MRGESLKSQVRQHLHRISKPGQYLGGEVNCVVKDTKQVLGRVCLAFTDTHAIGQSHHGLQVLYSIMNNDPRWACERAFTPWLDFEAMLVEQRLPLYSLETFTPLCECVNRYVKRLKMKIFMRVAVRHFAMAGAK